MTTQARHSPSDSELLETSQASLVARFGALKARLGAWVETCIAYYEAAALYDQLSGLSNAEVASPRAFRDVCDAREPRKDTESREG